MLTHGTNEGLRRTRQFSFHMHSSISSGFYTSAPSWHRDYHASLTRGEQRSHSTKPVTPRLHKKKIHFSSITKIKEDLLYEIFLWCLARYQPYTHEGNTLVCEDAPLEHYTTGRKNSTLHAFERCRLTLSHVCQYWRRVALAMPSLWSTLHYMPFDRLYKYLLRSVQAPLDFWWHAGEDDDTEALIALMNQVGRVRTMVLGVPHQVHKQVAEQVTFPVSLWRLKSLAFVYPFCAQGYPNDVLSGRHDDEETRRAVALPSYLSSCSMPQLTTVCIIGYKITDWTSNLFPSTLTSLHIQAYRTIGTLYTPRTTLSSALDTLSRMPLLRELVLADCLKGSKEELRSPSSRRITLPWLQYMRLSSPSETCVLVLEHLIVPSSCTVHAHFTTTGSSFGGQHRFFDIPAISNAILSKATCISTIGPSRPTIRSCAIWDDNETLSIHMFTDACLDPRDLAERLGDTGRRHPSSFQVVVELCSDLARKRAELLENLFARMPLREVESLCIHADAVHMMPTSGVTALVWNLPNVTAMTVRDIGGCGGIRRMLMTPPQDHLLGDASTPNNVKEDNDGTSWKRAFAFPRLKRLVHEASEFDEDVDVDFIDAGTKRNGCVALLQVLIERFLSGHSLEFLAVEGMKDKLHSVPMPTLGVLNWILEDVVTCLERTGTPTDWLDDEDRPDNVNYGPPISFPEHWFLPNDRINIEAIYALATTSTAWMDTCVD